MQVHQYRLTRPRPCLKKTPASLLASALTLALWSGACFAETGSVLKDSDVRRDPLGAADVIGQVKAKDSVEVKNRKGAWANVAAAEGLDGWIRLLNLRTGSGEKARAGFGAMASRFVTGSSGNSASTGVKGLNESTLRAATPDWDEAEKLALFVIEDNDAKTFAADGKLQAQTVNYLPEPVTKGKKS